MSPRCSSRNSVGMMSKEYDRGQRGGTGGREVLLIGRTAKEAQQALSVDRVARGSAPRRQGLV